MVNPLEPNCNNVYQPPLQTVTMHFVFMDFAAVIYLISVNQLTFVVVKSQNTPVEGQGGQCIAPTHS